MQKPKKKLNFSPLEHVYHHGADEQHSDVETITFGITDSESESPRAVVVTSN